MSDRIDPGAVALGMRVEVVSTPQTKSVVDQSAVSRIEQGHPGYRVKDRLRIVLESIESDLGRNIPGKETPGEWMKGLRLALGSDGAPLGQRPFVNMTREKLDSGIVLARGFVVAIANGSVILSESPDPVQPVPTRSDPRWVPLKGCLVREASESGPVQAGLVVTLRLEGGDATEGESLPGGRWSAAFEYADRRGAVQGAFTEVLSGLAAFLVEPIAEADKEVGEGGSAGAVLEQATAEGAPAEVAVVEDVPAGEALVPVAELGPIVSVVPLGEAIYVHGEVAVSTVGSIVVETDVAGVQGGTYRNSEIGAVLVDDGAVGVIAGVAVSSEGGTYRASASADGLRRAAVLARAAESTGVEPVFHSVLLLGRGNGTAEVIATDKYRVTRAVIPVEGERSEFRVLVDPRALDMVLAGANGEVRIVIESDRVVLDNGSLRVAAPVGDGASFPDISRFMPAAEPDIVAEFDREQLERVLEQVSNRVDEEKRCIEMVSRPGGFRVTPWFEGEKGEPFMIRGNQRRTDRVAVSDIALIQPLVLKGDDDRDEGFYGAFNVDKLRELVASVRSRRVSLVRYHTDRPYAMIAGEVDEGAAFM
jgi:hypothetical protein